MSETTSPAPVSGGDTRTQLAALDACLPHTAGCVAHRSAGPRGCICFHDGALARLLPVVERIADERAAEAWDAGYAAAQLDADEEPYSDRPERATWQPRQNPHRAASLRAASRGETR